MVQQGNSSPGSLCISFSITKKEEAVVILLLLKIANAVLDT